MAKTNGKRDKVNREALVGKWFHSFMGDGLVRGQGWQVHGLQGQVLALVSEGEYIVQLHKWTFEGPTNQVLVPLHNMTNWRFYDTPEQMRSGYTERLEQRRREILEKEEREAKVRLEKLAD
jgi:hypothetical protein